MTELRSLAQQLTEPHLKMIGTRIGKVPALLQELNEAISGSTDTGTGGSSTKQRILINSQALELMTSIEQTIKSGYADRYGQPAPTLITCINLIGQGEHPPDWTTWFTQEFNHAKEQIETMLRPKKLRRLDGITCPSCEQKVFGPERETCLYADCWQTNEHLLPISEWTVHCKSCNTNWKGHAEMKWLLVALAPTAC